MSYQKLNVIGEPSKRDINDENCKLFLIPSISVMLSVMSQDRCLAEPILNTSYSIMISQINGLVYCHEIGVISKRS